MAVLRLQPPDDSAQSRLPAIFERLMFLLFMAAFIGAGAMIAVGIFGVQLRVVVMGVLSAAIAWMAREWLCRRGRFEALVASFDSLAQRGDEGSGEETSFGRLARLLRELDQLERRRGSAKFDPWAVQSLRNEIRGMIADDPTLGRLLESHRRAA